MDNKDDSEIRKEDEESNAYIISKSNHKDLIHNVMYTSTKPSKIAEISFSSEQNKQTEAEADTALKVAHRPAILSKCCETLVKAYVKLSDFESLTNDTSSALEPRPLVRMDNGDWYEGEWNKATEKIEGYGLLLKKYYHMLYEGSHIEGVPHGRGRLVYANGDVYEGECVRGAAQGNGTQILSDGSTYHGRWVNNRKHGKGKQIFPDGTSYLGQFRDGQITGEGLMKYKNGDSYRGTFLEGVKHGEGIYEWAKGGKYKGMWFDNQQHGTGTRYYPDGQIYKGNFVKNER